MRTLVIAGLIAGLIPIQSVLLPHVAVWGVMPDLGLIVVCLAGFFGGELEGLLVGLAVGWIMGLFSAADLTVGMATKGIVGYLAGVAGRHIVYMTPVVLVLGLLAASCVSSLLTALVLTLNEQQDLWWALKTVVLPQAVFDGAVGGAFYWLAWSRLNIERFVSEYRT
ncbi:MAG TPA: hypothetical protein VFX56_08175 [Nitrospira sp.]|nr:hypothetical protein [Nitrospira sp.]